MPTETHHYLIYAGLGALCAGIGIALMRAVALVENATRRAKLPEWARPAIGGLVLIPVALVSPQVLSAGHGALHADLAVGAPMAFIATIFLAKCAASIVSLGFGFRGGLFFASLFLGTLVGHLFAGSLASAIGHDIVDPRNAALVGIAVLAAALVSSTIVRETFGYSFSTWRLHLRGETIKSARDVGWVKTLTAGRMMRRDAKSIAAATTIAAFRRRVPLGATSRTVLVDEDDRYAGIVQTPTAYAEGLDTQSPVGPLAINVDAALTPMMDIAEVMRRFDASNADELAVLDNDRRVLGILSETFVRRRYAEELEKAQRELFGER